MVKEIFQGFSIETNEFAFNIKILQVLVKIAKFEENSRL